MFPYRSTAALNSSFVIPVTFISDSRPYVLVPDGPEEPKNCMVYAISRISATKDLLERQNAGVTKHALNEEKTNRCWFKPERRCGTGLRQLVQINPLAILEQLDLRDRMHFPER